MKERVRVKICGITNEADARLAIEAGADALGFNLFSGSKRHVLAEDLAHWIDRLARDAARVAVMVNPTLDEILRVQPMFDVIQLHGAEGAVLCAAAASSGRIWKAVPLTPDLDEESLGAFEAEAFVIDSVIPGAFGGTGILIDLEGAARLLELYSAKPVWLSGGLTPENVAAAVEKVRPYGVDVASGVEMPGNPRRKDAEQVRAFITNAKSV